MNTSSDNNVTVGTVALLSFLLAALFGIAGAFIGSFWGSTLGVSLGIGGALYGAFLHPLLGAFAARGLTWMFHWAFRDQLPPGWWTLGDEHGTGASAIIFWPILLFLCVPFFLIAGFLKRIF